MTRYFLHIISASLLLVSGPLTSISQSIEGRWEGIMADEILQVNIVEKGKRACGYTYDFIIDNPVNSCKAYFSGTYDAAEGYWRLKGYRFIENSGSHVLMSINLRYTKENGKPVLKGFVMPKTSAEDTRLLTDKVPVELRREYISKSELNSLRKVCFPVDEAPGVPQVKNKKKTPEAPPTSAPEKPLQAPDSRDKIVKEQTEAPGPTLKKQLELPSDVSNRKRNEVSRIPVATKSIKLKVFDNGIVDNDTVTIFYNKKLLISKQKLSDKAIEIDIELDEKEKLHEIIMYAENLGSIPPNTALIVVNAGDKRYELFSSASMEENAVLVFEYRPEIK